MWTNLKLILLGATVLLAPVAIRVWTWSEPEKHNESAADVEKGRELFVHEWTVNDPLSPQGDGLGPVFNATSCAACHRQGGIGGGGDLKRNVTTFVRFTSNGTSQQAGVVHAFAKNHDFLETLNQLRKDFTLQSMATLEFVRQNELSPDGTLHLSQRNTPALFGSKLIDEIPDRVIIAEARRQRLRWGLRDANTEAHPVGRALRVEGGQIGKFGWKAQSPTLASFVQAACANELGLGNPGQMQPVSLSVESYRAPGLDLTQKQCDQITAYCASLPQPEDRSDESEDARLGKQHFNEIGCADCHRPDLGLVKGIYSDLLLHRMGLDLQANGSYYAPTPKFPDSPSSPGETPRPDEWRTPPLWGVADSAPYLHDGRAKTLEEAIKLHAGQALLTRSRFDRLSLVKRQQLIAFLKSLRAPSN